MMFKDAADASMRWFGLRQSMVEAAVYQCLDILCTNIFGDGLTQECGGICFLRE
jgi:hypothetical protein